MNDDGKTRRRRQHFSYFTFSFLLLFRLINVFGLWSRLGITAYWPLNLTLVLWKFARLLPNSKYYFEFHVDDLKDEDKDSNGTFSIEMSHYPGSHFQKLKNAAWSNVQKRPGNWHLSTFISTIPQILKAINFWYFFLIKLASKTVWHVTFSHVTYSLWENEFSSFCSSWLLSSFLSYFVVSTSKRVNKHLKHPLVFTFFRMEKFGWRALLFLIMSTVSPKWKPKIRCN